MRQQDWNLLANRINFAWNLQEAQLGSLLNIKLKGDLVLNPKYGIGFPFLRSWHKIRPIWFNIYVFWQHNPWRIRGCQAHTKPQPYDRLFSLYQETLRSISTWKGSNCIECSPFTQRWRSLSWLLSCRPSPPSDFSPCRAAELAPSATLARLISQTSATDARPHPTIP